MSSIKKWLVFAAVAFHLAGAQAISTAIPTTFVGLTWAYSGASAGNVCTRLILDATGDIVHGNGFALHGVLNCPSSSFAVSGTAYFDASGNFNMTIFQGAGVIAVCNRLSNFSGQCIISNGNGLVIDTATVSFL